MINFQKQVYYKQLQSSNIKPFRKNSKQQIPNLQGRKRLNQLCFQQKGQIGFKEKNKIDSNKNMSSHSLNNNYSQQFETYEQQQHSQRQAEQYFVRQRLRNQAYKRTTDYAHPRVNFFDHQPIDCKQSQQLRKQLITLYKPKVEFVRGQYDPQQLTKDYTHTYDQFVQMTVKNQLQQKLLTQSIGQMHQIADILLNNPLSLMDNNKDILYLYSKTEPSQNQQEQINRIFQKYQQAYKQGVQVEDNQAQDTIKKAKQFLRDRYS